MALNESLHRNNYASILKAIFPQYFLTETYHSAEYHCIMADSKLIYVILFYVKFSYSFHICIKVCKYFPFELKNHQ